MKSLKSNETVFRYQYILQRSGVQDLDKHIQQQTNMERGTKLSVYKTN